MMISIPLSRTSLVPVQAESLRFQALYLFIKRLNFLSVSCALGFRRIGTAQFHGGPIAAFIDIVGDFAVGMAVGGGVPTINLRIDYLKPAVGTLLTGTARVRRTGRTVALVDVDVHDEKQGLVAVGRGTYSPQRG